MSFSVWFGEGFAADTMVGDRLFTVGDLWMEPCGGPFDSEDQAHEWMLLSGFCPRADRLERVEIREGERVVWWEQGDGNGVSARHTLKWCGNPQDCGISPGAARLAAESAPATLSAVDGGSRTTIIPAQRCGPDSLFPPFPTANPCPTPPPR